MVAHFRAFTIAEGHVPDRRNVDDDAPAGLRQEFAGLVLHLAGRCDNLDPATVYRAAALSLGVLPVGEPYRGGFERALGREIGRAEWPQVYDLMVRLWPDFEAAGCGADYRDGVRAILSAHAIAWDMDDRGQLHRVMHPVAQARVDAALAVLSEDRFDDARCIFSDARAAYDDHPRRNREVCANSFDAMEAVGKIAFAMPTATFHDVLQRIRDRGALNVQVVGVLESVNVLRHRTFGHGAPFPLQPEEVEFTYTVCTAGIVLLAR